MSHGRVAVLATTTAPLPRLLMPAAALLAAGRNSLAAAALSLALLLTLAEELDKLPPRMAAAITKPRACTTAGKSLLPIVAGRLAGCWDLREDGGCVR